jgi:transcriptional regulator with XRE-family HTH domain|tara:strand:- start:687 stop:899 length:213 start_codon:yes stop_codon:yes gene_type:complete
MTLNEYRMQKNLTYAALAKLLGFDQATMARRWCLPRAHPQSQTPSAKNMANIIEITQSAVTPNDFYFKRD